MNGLHDMGLKLCRSPLVSNKIYENRQRDIDAMKLQTRCCSSTHQHYSRSSLVKINNNKNKKQNRNLICQLLQPTSWGEEEAGWIFPVQTRLYGRFSLVYGWGGHINNVMYPSGFNAIKLQSALCRGWNVWCCLTPGQTCHWSESRSQHGNCSWKKQQQQNTSTTTPLKWKTNALM